MAKPPFASKHPAKSTNLIKELLLIPHDERTEEQQKLIENYVEQKNFERMGERPGKSMSERYDTTLIGRRPGNQEYAILAFSELVHQILNYHNLKLKSLAKELGWSKKKLNSRLDSGQLTIRQMSDIMFVLGKSVEFSAKDDTSTAYEALL